MQYLANNTRSKYLQCVRLLSYEPSQPINIRAKPLAKNASRNASTPARNSYGNAESLNHQRTIKANERSHSIPTRNVRTGMERLAKESPILPLSSRLTKRSTEETTSPAIRPPNVVNFNPLRSREEDQPFPAFSARMNRRVADVKEGKKRSDHGEVRQLRVDYDSRQRRTISDVRRGPHDERTSRPRTNAPLTEMQESSDTQRESSTRDPPTESDATLESDSPCNITVQIDHRSTDLNQLFNSSPSSNIDTLKNSPTRSHQERRGGDYASYLPQAELYGDAKALAVQNARWTLARRREIGRRGRSRILEIVKRSVGLDNKNTHV